MTRIESDTVEVNNTAAGVFNYLSNFNNFKALMPHQVTDWESTDEECTFNLNGMAKIGMRIIEKTPTSSIKITSFGKVPFDFTLNVNIVETAANTCKGQLIFESDINPFMKMMVEKPLTHFFNGLAQKMKDIPVA
jgi:carbon monoxide dehydrogenase subunit G